MVQYGLQISVLLSTGCVSLDKSLNNSVPHFPHLKIGIVCEGKITCVQCLE